MKRFLSVIIIISMILSMFVPFVFAVEAPGVSDPQPGTNIHHISIGNGSDWMVVDASSDGLGGDLVQWGDQVVASFDSSDQTVNIPFYGRMSVDDAIPYLQGTTACFSENSPDGFHHCQYAMTPDDYEEYVSGSPIFNRLVGVCEYCGVEFSIGSGDIKNLYHGKIADAGITNMTQDSEGVLTWRPTWDDLTFIDLGVNNSSNLHIHSISDLPFTIDTGTCINRIIKIDNFRIQETISGYLPARDNSCYSNGYSFKVKFFCPLNGIYSCNLSSGGTPFYIRSSATGNHYKEYYFHYSGSEISCNSFLNHSNTYYHTGDVNTSVYSLPIFVVIPDVSFSQNIPQYISFGDINYTVNSFDYSNLTYYVVDDNDVEYTYTFYDDSVTVSYVDNGETIVNNYYYYLPSGSGQGEGDGNSSGSVDLFGLEQLLQDIYDLIALVGLDSFGDSYLESIYNVINSFTFSYGSGSGSGSGNNDYSDLIAQLLAIRTQLSILSQFSASDRDAFMAAYTSYLISSLSYAHGPAGYSASIGLMTNFLLQQRLNLESQSLMGLDTIDKLYFELMTIGVSNVAAADQLFEIANLLVSQGVDLDIVAAVIQDISDNSSNLTDSVDYILGYLEDVVIHYANDEEKLDDIYDAIGRLTAAVVASGAASSAASLLDNFLNFDDLIPDIDIPGIGGGGTIPQLGNTISQPFSFKSLANGLFSWIGSLLSFIWDFFIPTSSVTALVSSFNQTTDFWEINGSYNYKPYRIASFISRSSYENSSSAVQALFDCAEQYLGYPYVWGGSSPSTSFDCSGFVYYVLNASGVYETSRKTAQGFYNACTPISASEAQPGDLIFFSGTYSTSDTVTHIGFYAGDGKMLHCGDPIQYTSINTDYWQQHFYSFGRLNYVDPEGVSP